MHVVELTVVKGGETKVVRVTVDVNREDDDFNRAVKRLSGEGWIITVSKWLA